MLHLVENPRSPHSEALAVIGTAPEDDNLLRLAALKRYEILDTPPDDAWDSITALAAELFDVPIAFIGIIDSDRVWLKSRHGLNLGQLPRNSEPCRSTMLSAEPWTFAQPAAAGSRADAPPTGDLGAGFYIGVPLRSSDGYNIGTLCVVSREQRPVDEQKIRHLANMASLVMDLLELRLLARRAAVRALTLAGEVDHRVMNSLQFVASLLSMQSRAVHTTEAADQLRIAASRVAAVARVHRYLSADGALERVSIMGYLRRLCGELSSVLGAAVEVFGTEATISKTQVLALGLVVNELVTNAKKHGGDAIRVTLAADGIGRFELCVIDDGPGLPKGFSVDRQSGGLGMKVVAALVGQLDGHLGASANQSGRGTCFTVSFPDKP
jgi:two-component sensor histidine kinase